jgi:esterase/lipase
MATNAELKAEYLILQQQLVDINAQITAVIKSKNKKYTYSNQETTHSAETQSLQELRDMKKDIREQMNSIENQLTGIFVQLKN